MSSSHRTGFLSQSNRAPGSLNKPRLLPPRDYFVAPGGPRVPGVLESPSEVSTESNVGEWSSRSSAARDDPSSAGRDDPSRQYSREELLELLDDNVTFGHENLREAVKAGKRVSDEAHARVQYALRNPDLKRWMTDNQSRMIVIESHFDGDSKPSSDLTSYAGGLHAWNQEASNMLTISSFCGYYDYPLEQTAVTLLRSLCDQLLRINDVSENFGCDFSGKQAQNLEEGSFIELGMLWESLMDAASKQESGLLCVIDGLHLVKMEDEQQFFQLVTSFKEILRLFDQSDVDCLLKIVLTYPQVWDHSLIDSRNLVSVTADMVQQIDFKRNAEGTVDASDIDEMLGLSTE